MLLSFTSCGGCGNCRDGHPAYCATWLPHNLIGGARRDGSATITRAGEPLGGHFFGQSSFARMAVADERSVVKVDPAAPLETLAPLGCGVQTGVGAVWNVLKPGPGGTLVVPGAGAVGLSAVMAAALTPAPRIIAVDLVAAPARPGPGAGRHPRGRRLERGPPARIAEITGGAGCDGVIETTGNVQVLRQAVDSLAARGTAVVVGAPPFGTEVGLDVNGLLGGKTVIGLTLGDSETQTFIPLLAAMVADGRLPVCELVTTYDFADIEQAVADVKSGETIKPVLTFADRSNPTHRPGAHTHGPHRQGRRRHRQRPGPRPRLRQRAGRGRRRRRRQRRRRRHGRAPSSTDHRGGRHGRRRGRCRSAPPRPPSAWWTARCRTSAGSTSWSPTPGVLRDRVLWKMTDEDFDTVIEVTCGHLHLRPRRRGPALREQGEGGRLILVGSPAGQRGNFGQTNYAAAKAGIAAMARTWAMELARAGITVNAIVPVAATAMTETIPAFAPYVEAMANGEPLPDFVRKAAGFGTPEDCAGLVVFLASDAAAAVTGQCIGIGGDKLALWSHPQEVARLTRRRLERRRHRRRLRSRSAERRRPSASRRPSFPSRSARRPEHATYCRHRRRRARRDRRAHPRRGVLGCGHASLADELRDGADEYFKVEGGGASPPSRRSPPTTASGKMAAVVFTVDAEAATGTAPVPNEEVAEAAAAQPRRAHPLRQHRPGQGRAGVREARRLVEELRGAGLQVPPQHAGVLPQRPRRRTRSTR